MRGLEKATLPMLTLVAATTGIPGIATAHDPGETLDAFCTPGANPLWILTAQNMAEACGQFYGRPGYHGVKPCQPPGPDFVGFPRVVLQAIHEQVHDKPGCDPTLRELLA